MRSFIVTAVAVAALTISALGIGAMTSEPAAAAGLARPVAVSVAPAHATGAFHFVWYYGSDGWACRYLHSPTGAVLHGATVCLRIP